MLQQSSKLRFTAASSAIQALPRTPVRGQVVAAAGLALEVAGLSRHAVVGDRVRVQGLGRSDATAEIIGFRAAARGDDRASVARTMLFDSLTGIGPGTPVLLGRSGSDDGLPVGDAWLGRVIDPLGRPIDGRGALARGKATRPTRRPPPDAVTRTRLGPRIDLGVRAVNAFATCRLGQRLGLFAGSGVGKSTLLAMLARRAATDVVVLSLVGERGREVREFIEDDLGREGLARSVIVVATSDTTPLMRREAAYTAVTVAEHFRDQGRSVLLLMDSLTRFCAALREIGLAAGEPPAARGFPPSVFAELPRLLERAGPGPDRGEQNTGYITALFTVLVDGDDHNEPVADTVRGILDGHILLDRRIAEAGRYPAIDILRSLSRTVPGCLSAEEAALARRARALLSLQAEMADLVRLGAYRSGTDPKVDEACRLAPRIEAMLHQGREEATDVETSFRLLRDAMSPAAQA